MVMGRLRAGILGGVRVTLYIPGVMRDVCEVPPPMLKESAYGLGATTWEVVWRVVLPYTKVGVIGGIMLGLGRAPGATHAGCFLLRHTPPPRGAPRCPPTRRALPPASQRTPALRARAYLP